MRNLILFLLSASFLSIVSLMGLESCTRKQPVYNWPEITVDTTFSSNIYCGEGITVSRDSLIIIYEPDTSVSSILTIPEETMFVLIVEEVDTCYTFYKWKRKGLIFEIDSIQVDTFYRRFFYAKGYERIYFDPCDKMIGRVFKFDD